MKTITTRVKFSFLLILDYGIIPLYFLKLWMCVLYSESESVEKYSSTHIFFVDK